MSKSKAEYLAQNVAET